MFFILSFCIDKNILQKSKILLKVLKRIVKKMGVLNHKYQISYYYRNYDGNILETNGILTSVNEESRSTIGRCSGNKLLVKLLEIIKFK